MKNKLKYPFVIKSLDESDGGGFLIEFPDLPGCMADGETIEQTISEGKKALNAWIETAKHLKRDIPEPNSYLAENFSGKYLQRLPKSLHAELSKKADYEGISINSLALSYIAKGLGFEDSNSYR